MSARDRLDRMLDRVPGYAGYREKERRRDSDRAIGVRRDDTFGDPVQRRREALGELLADALGLLLRRDVTRDRVDELPFDLGDRAPFEPAIAAVLAPVPVHGRRGRLARVEPLPRGNHGLAIFGWYRLALCAVMAILAARGFVAIAP